MRSRTPLALMEQVVMVLVFALAAALCVQVFVFSDQTSRRNEARDRAVAAAQNAAEVLKSAGGDVEHALTQAARRLGGVVEEGLLYVLYDAGWTPVAGIKEAAYALYAREAPVETQGLRKAEVWVSGTGDGGALFTLTVAWQGEAAHG